MVDPVIAAEAAFLGQLDLALGEARLISQKIGNTILSLSVNLARSSLATTNPIHIAARVVPLLVTETSTIEELVIDLQRILGVDKPFEIDMSSVTDRDKKLLRIHLETTIDLAKEYLDLIPDPEDTVD
jgi:hypothetical protein